MAFLICFKVQRIDDGQQRGADDSKPFAMHLLMWNPQHKQKTTRSNCLVHFFLFPHPKSYYFKNTRWELVAYYNLETLGEGVSLTTRNTREADTGSTYHRGWDWFGCVINPLVLSSGEFSNIYVCHSPPLPHFHFHCPQQLCDHSTRCCVRCSDRWRVHWPEFDIFQDVYFKDKMLS